MRSDESERNRLNSDHAKPEQQSGSGDSARVQPIGSVSCQARRFRGWRRWILRFSLLLGSPILFFGLAEAGLRWSGYGYPTSFFLGPDASGAYRSNDQFGWRFFPRPLARRPQPFLLPVKSPGTIRIFIVGSSAAMGIPDPAFGFGRILEVMLRERYPGTRFEVVNAAMTAVNSHVALEISEECASHGADIFVVYMGNNEVTGPYGPGTVFQQWSRRLAIVRASIRVKSTRVGQLLSDVAEECRRGEDAPSVWTGMEMCENNRIAADSPQLALVYDNFRRNLIDICDGARRADAAVVLATVAANLQDFPPLASLHRSDLSPADLTRWESIYRAGVALESSGDLRKATEQYEAAAGIDDRFAELQFRLGRCLLAAGRSSEARQRFALACDLDALRFRADRRINAIIREVAAGQEAGGVYFVDAQRALADSAPAASSILGGDLFQDHVHMTFNGNYRLARAVLDQVAKALPEGVRVRQRGAVPSRAQCAKLLALSRWDEFQMAAWALKLTSRAPFTNQLDYAVRQAAVGQRVESLGRLASTREALEEAARTYEAALTRWPDDWQLHDHLAAVFHVQGKVEKAVAHWRDAVRLLPNNIDSLHQLALVLATSPDASLRNGREAIELAQRAVALAAGQEPKFLGTLAAAYAESGQFTKAVETAEQAVALASSQNKTALADALRDRIGSYKVGSPLQDPR
jgi:tetratricopeptide (TPR) repeat protein